MDLLNFFFNLHQIMYSFGKQREKIWGEGHFKTKKKKNIHGIWSAVVRKSKKKLC